MCTCTDVVWRRLPSTESSLMLWYAAIIQTRLQFCFIDLKSVSHFITYSLSQRLGEKRARQIEFPGRDGMPIIFSNASPSIAFSRSGLRSRILSPEATTSLFVAHKPFLHTPSMHSNHPSLSIAIRNRILGTSPRRLLLTHSSLQSGDSEFTDRCVGSRWRFVAF